MSIGGARTFEDVTRQEIFGFGEAQAADDLVIIDAEDRHVRGNGDAALLGGGERPAGKDVVREPEDAFELEPFGVLRRRDRDKNLLAGTGGHAA